MIAGRDTPPAGPEAGSVTAGRRTPEPLHTPLLSEGLAMLRTHIAEAAAVVALALAVVVPALAAQSAPAAAATASGTVPVVVQYDMTWQ
ncbi:hypothetical protein GCM10020229_43720 [Kitasatospora albolonga]